MTSSVLTGLLSRKPFRPFWTWIGHDTEITVSRPSQVRFDPPGLAGRFPTVIDDNGREFIVDLELVRTIEMVP